MWTAVWVMSGALLVTGCVTTKCTLAACGGSETLVSFVDGQGEPVRTQGEVRSHGSRYEHSPVTFDCRRDSPWCEGGVLGVSAPQGSDGVLEVRFRSAEGGFTEWQALDLEVSEHTDPDFNGPGCSCTSYEAAPLTVLVPPEAALG